MSYSMSISAKKFSFDNTKIQEAFDALAAYDDETAGRLEKKEEWKYLPAVLKIKKLSNAIGIPLVLDKENTKIESITFEGVGRIDEDALKAIAPFILPDSYIQMTGEDGAVWRYVFDGKTMTEKRPKMVWE